MRIERPREAERFGAVILHGIQKVFELDAGLLTGSPASEVFPAIPRVSHAALLDIEQQMAIVVPVRNERIRLLEGVLCGIPHHCLVIVVSNSPRSPVDRFHMEQRAIENLKRYTQKDIIVVHQNDPVLAEAFAGAGYPDLLDGQGLVKNGKAEGMILATLLARLCGKKYIGFIDADNYFPGAVQEYAKAYGAGFVLSNARYAMVRIAWHSKPKILGSHLFFAKYGRASVHTNEILNRFISHYTGFGTDVVKTGNAGEHAMTMDLAMLLTYASGYSIEPHHFIDLWETFGGVVESPFPDVMREQVEIYQIESRNPHLHEEKGEDHVIDMIYAAMQVIYHSSLCPKELRHDLRQEMIDKGFIRQDDEPAQPIYYPSLTKVDLSAFFKVVRDQPYASFLLEPTLAEAASVTEVNGRNS